MGAGVAPLPPAMLSDCDAALKPFAMASPSAAIG